MKIVEIKKDETIKEALDNFTKCVDNYDCVLLVAIQKDGAQILMTSNCNALEKSFMTSTVNAWMNSWFSF